MSVINLQKQMLEKVADALGGDLLPKVVFVGGCTTGLLVTDELTKEQIRYTNDVDLIVHVISYLQLHRLQEQLRTKGFVDIIYDEAPICRMGLGELTVDFMPADKNILGFGNDWFEEAMTNAQPYKLNSEITIQLVSPVYFVATKLTAYNGRGNNDPLSSPDLEDIVNVLEGRCELVEEIRNSSDDIKMFISEQFQELIEDQNFEYLIQSSSKGNLEAEKLIYEKIEACIIND